MKYIFNYQPAYYLILSFTGLFLFSGENTFGENSEDVFINVTFQVDMVLEEVHPEGVFISCNTLDNFAHTKMNQVSSTLWSITVESPIGYEVLWKFLNGPDLYESNAGLAECSIKGGYSGSLRTFITGNNDVTLPAVCYGFCDNCDIISNTDQYDSAQKIAFFPNPASTELTVSYRFNTPKDVSIRLFGLSGSLIRFQINHKIKEGQSEMDLKGLKEGVYWLAYEFDNQRFYKKLLVQH